LPSEDDKKHHKKVLNLVRTLAPTLQTHQYCFLLQCQILKS